MTPNKLLTRLPILSAQIETGHNSYKLKNEIRQILYLLCQHNKITKNVYNNHGRKYDCNKRSQNVCFSFDWPKDVDKNLKHKIEFIIKSNKSLAENKTKNDIEKFFLKYKHGNNVHEHGKQQNGWTA